MAFRENTQRSNDNNGTDQSWKAAGFLNLYLPTADGGRRKLGAIPLREKNVNEKKLFEALKADETLVEAIRGKLEIEFRTAEATAGSAFDI